jgi:hypothetical protein
MVSVSALAEAPMHGDGQRVSAAQDLGKVAQDVLGGLSIARSDLHNLDLRGTNIAVLPEGLSLGGDLYLDSTKINALPEGLSVGGGLYLRGTKITALPEGLSVGGELYLDGTDITELPKGLRVGGNLDLSGTKITELPRVPAFAPLADFRHRQRRLDRRHRRYRGSRKASVSWSLARL